MAVTSSQQRFLTGACIRVEVLQSTIIIFLPGCLTSVTLFFCSISYFNSVIRYSTFDFTLISDLSCSNILMP